MKILKFNEGVRKDFYSSVIEDIMYIFSPLTDNGFEISEKSVKNSFFRINLSMRDGDMEEYGQTFRDIYLFMTKEEEEYDVESIKKLEVFDKFISTVNDNIDEIKDRLEELSENESISIQQLSKLHKMIDDDREIKLNLYFTPNKLTNNPYIFDSASMNNWWNQGYENAKSGPTHEYILTRRKVVKLK